MIFGFSHSNGFTIQTVARFQLKLLYNKTVAWIWNICCLKIIKMSCPPFLPSKICVLQTECLFWIGSLKECCHRKMTAAEECFWDEFKIPVNYFWMGSRVTVRLAHLESGQYSGPVKMQCWLTLCVSSGFSRSRSYEYQGNQRARSYHHCLTIIPVTERHNGRNEREEFFLKTAEPKTG